MTFVSKRLAPYLILVLFIVFGLVLPQDASAFHSPQTRVGYVASGSGLVGGTLTVGSRGVAVTELQQKLATLGYFKEQPTGYFGPITRAALMAYQGASGLEAVGYVGPRTRALLAAVGTTPASSNTVVYAGTTAPVVAGASTSVDTSLAAAKELTRNRPSLRLSVEPDTITSGGSVKLSWRGRNVTSCVAEGGWSGAKEVRGSETLSGMTVPETYVLTCVGTGGSVTKSVTIEVTDPTPIPAVTPTLTLSTNTTLVASGGSATLSWASTDATSCTATGGWSGIKSTSGSQTVSNITADSLYTLTCTGAGGTISKSVGVHVAVEAPPPSTTPAPTVTFSASATSVVSGGNIILTWTSVDATSCTASGSWSGTKATSGIETMSNLTSARTYTLACTGQGGTTTKSVTVGIATTQPPPPVTAGAFEVYGGCEAPAATYKRTVYIDPNNGSDLGDGSASLPLKTLAAAVSAKKIKSGDRVMLLPGNHGDILATASRNPELTGSEWVWIDAQDGAVIERLDVRDLSRWLVTNAAFTNAIKNVNMLSFTGGSNHVAANNELYSAKNSSGWSATTWIDNTANGIASRNTRCLSLLDNDIRNVRFGISVLSDGLTADNRVKTLIRGNTITGFSADGIRPLGSEITVRNNRIIESMTGSADGDGNHDDGIQIFALGGAVFSYISLENNWIQETTSSTRPLIGQLQGIGHFDGEVRNLTVRNNVILVTAYHGINIGSPRDSVVENNTVAHAGSDTNNTWIRVDGSKERYYLGPPQNTIVRNNIATHFTIATTGVTQTNNIIVKTPASAFAVFDHARGVFDLHAKAGGILDGRGAGASGLSSGLGSVAGAQSTAELERLLKQLQALLDSLR